MDISRINTRWIEGDTQPEEPVARETTKEKVERQRRERVENLGICSGESRSLCQAQGGGAC